MKSEEYTQIFVQEKQFFLDKGLEGSELKEFLVSHIVELEKRCEQDYMIARSKISAALSLIDDNETHVKLQRKLKEAKVTYKNESVFTHNKGEIGIDGKKNPEFRLEEEEKKKEIKEANAWKLAIKACKMFTTDASKVYNILKSKYPKMTIEQVKQELGV